MDPMASEQKESSVSIQRKMLIVKGTVQGVGFRPFVYRIALNHELAGYVCNQSGDVIIDIEGPAHQISLFIKDILTHIKEPAKVEQIQKISLRPEGYTQFYIKESQEIGSTLPIFPPDLSLCESCRLDIFNTNSRFFRYPFTSCTDCGPRFSIIRTLPFDRLQTSMNPFSLCPSCYKEYSNPKDRRFHAQAMACPECGPKISIWKQGKMLNSDEWLLFANEALKKGEILAVKGLGGFHLVCDARQKLAIHTLRSRKKRPRKPLALMVKDIETAEEYFQLSDVERRVLTGIQAPIVLVRPKSNLASILPIETLAIGYQRLGIMLPYTPLHTLLLSHDIPFLVVTSGNQSGFPITINNDEALDQLKDMADLLICHDREIVTRVEDSVCQIVDEQLHFLRRARGYVPEKLEVPVPVWLEHEHPVVVGIGAEMKNTFCFLNQKHAWVSQHQGELENVEQMASWKQAYQHTLKLLGKEPTILAYDPHPYYRITMEAKDKADGVKDLFPIYHHHAHMSSCMAEHGLTSPVIGCILDGTGYGRDGALWGFEILTGDYVDFQRKIHLQPLVLPGGDAAIRYPWMMAVSMLYRHFQKEELLREWIHDLIPIEDEKLSIVLAQLDGRIPSSKASSAGRLFDAVSALLGLCWESTYEGEAATLLGELAEKEGGAINEVGYYSFGIENGQWNIAKMIKEILLDKQNGESIEKIAKKFHHTIVEMIYKGVYQVYQETAIQQVVLSGGVWNNRYLLSFTRKKLVESGFRVFVNQKVPVGDGGIALGQAVSAIWRWYEHVFVGSGQDH